MEGDFIKIHHSLTPLSWIYGLVVRTRNLLFEMGILKSHSFTIPVIAVGNITIGGSGKTPHVEYLVRLLQKKVQLAVLSRGYKRKTRGYILATPDTTAADIGDEPYQMYRKYGNNGTDLPPVDSKGNKPHPIYVAVNANRCKGIRRITGDEETRDTDVILLDDAYQHRYVKPGVNILLVDYHRLIIYDKLLPAGRLREPEEGKRRADIVIVTKCPKTLKPMEFRVLTKALDLFPYQKLYFTTLSYGPMYMLFKPEKPRMLISDITSKHSIILLTGIASPQQLTLDLQHLTSQITPMTYGDHHRFTIHDAENINDTFASMPEPRLIVTTEKDAARLINLEGLSPDVCDAICVLPVEIEFMLDGGESFNEKILSYVQKNSKNSILLKDKAKGQTSHSFHLRSSKSHTKETRNEEQTSISKTTIRFK